MILVFYILYVMILTTIMKLHTITIYIYIYILV